MSGSLLGVWGPGVTEAPERFLEVGAGGDPGGCGHLCHGSTAGGQAVTGWKSQGVDIGGQGVHVEKIVEGFHGLRHGYGGLLLDLWRSLKC